MVRRHGNSHEVGTISIAHGNLPHGLSLCIRLQITALRYCRQLVFRHAVDVAAVEARAGAGRHDAFANAVGLARGDDVQCALVVHFEVPAQDVTIRQWGCIVLQ